MKKYFFICFLNFIYLFSIFYTNDAIYTGRAIETTTANEALPYDIENNNNIALLFTLTNEGGRIENLNAMKSIFADGSLGFSSDVFHNKPARFVYEKITEVSASLDEEATLLLYLNGHGGGSNKNFAMEASDQRLKFSKILQAIKNGKPVKRLIIFVDTCHAEGAINEGFQGGGRLLRNAAPKPTEITDGADIPVLFKENNKIYFGEDTKAYEELLIITSSNAADLTVRGVFARNMKKAFEQIKNKKEASVYDFLSLFAQLGAKSNQYPYYKVIPESILGEPLFENIPARTIPIKDKKGEKFKKSYIITPE